MSFGVLLSVREKASRFPGKVIKPLGDGNVTEFLIRRLKQSACANKIILATSTDYRDEVLTKIADSEGIQSFRGSPDDKLLRYRDACRLFNLEFIVVVDGDDPFVSVEHIDLLINEYRRSPADYLVYSNLPLGATGFGLSAAALELVCLGRDEGDTEIWARYFTEDSRFICRDIKEINALYARPDIRMTLDYEEDYNFFVRIVEELKSESSSMSFKSIMTYLSLHPEVTDINRHAQKAYEEHLKISKINRTN